MLPWGKNHLDVSNKTFAKRLRINWIKICQCCDYASKKERETLNELAVKYEVSPVMISRWKKEFIIWLLIHRFSICKSQILDVLFNKTMRYGV